MVKFKGAVLVSLVRNVGIFIFLVFNKHHGKNISNYLIMFDKRVSYTAPIKL